MVTQTTNSSESNNIPVLTKAPSTAKRCYTVEELCSFLGIGRIAVYELLKRNEFHWVKIGGRYLISKASFDAWLDGNL